MITRQQQRARNGRYPDTIEERERTIDEMCRDIEAKVAFDEQREKAQRVLNPQPKRRGR